MSAKHPPKTRIKVYYRKSLEMSPGKLAAQVAHAVLGIVRASGPVSPTSSIIVLEASDRKFNEMQSTSAVPCYVQNDLGITGLEPGTPTCLALFPEFVYD